MDLKTADQTTDGMVEAYRAMVAECDHPLHRSGTLLEQYAAKGQVTKARKLFREIVDSYIRNRTIHWANRTEDETGARPTREEQYDYAVQLIGSLGFEADTSRRQWRLDYPDIVWPSQEAR